MIISLSLFVDAAAGKSTSESESNQRMVLENDFTANLSEFDAVPEHLPFNLNSIKSSSISISETSSVCRSGVCLVQGKIEFHLKAVPGSATRLRVINKERSIDSEIMVIVSKTGIRYPLNILYKTCQSEVRAGTYWKCTGNCDASKARDEMCKTIQRGKCPRKPKYIRVEDQSMWGCEPDHCAIFQGGCLTMACVNVAKQDDCYTIVQSGQGVFWVEICFYYFGKYQCIVLSETEVKTSAKMSMGLTTQQNSEDPQIMAISSSHELLAGAINNRGEYADKFGRIQFDAENPMVGDCGPNWYHDGMYSLSCGIANSESKIQECCRDTWSLKDDLIPKKWKLSGLQASDDSVNAGMAVISMVVNGFIKETSKVGKVLNFQIQKVDGCWNCHDGLLVSAMVKASLVGNYKLDCGGAPLGIDHLMVTTVDKMVHFKTSSESKVFTIKCKLGRKKSSARGTAKDKDFIIHSQHRDLVVSSSSTDKCFLFCNVDEWFNPFNFSITAIVKKLIIIATIFFIVFF